MWTSVLSRFARAFRVLFGHAGELEIEAPPLLPLRSVEPSASWPPAEAGEPGIDAVIQGDPPGEELTQAEGRELSVVIGELLDRCRGAVLARIERANRMTSTEVLAAGESLERIVERARAQVDATGRALAGITAEDPNGVGQLFARQTKMTTTHVGAMRSLLSEQADVVQQALGATSQIAAIGKEVSRVALQTRILSLNANIEAARLGAAGAGFEVIASQMRVLTDEVERANRRIEEMARALLKSLPKAVERTSQMSERIEGFARDLSDNVQQANQATDRLNASISGLLETGDHEIGAILSGSQQALSHLQFQDPVAQSLLIVDGDLQGLSARMNELIQLLQIEQLRVPESQLSAFEPAQAHRILHAGEVVALDSEAEAVEAGDVLLF